MIFFKKKIIFLIFKNSYRQNALGNFGRSNVYENSVVINLSGKIKSIIGYFFYKFNFGKFISLDGDPFLINKNNSINIWFSGTKMKIKKNFLNYENNYVNVVNPAILSNEKYFNLYPIIKKNQKIDFYKDRKIIFMGKFYFEPSNNHYFSQCRLQKIRSDVLHDFKILEKSDFWNKHLLNKDEKEKLENYKIVKTYIRKEILKVINCRFEKKLYIYSSKLPVNNNFQLLKPVYDINKIKNIYAGNICIDTGPIPGSVTFSTRAIQIFESGGILQQTWQQDSKKKLDSMYDDIACCNIDQLIENINSLLTNDEKFLTISKKNNLFLLDCKKKISKTLDDVFNN